MVSGVLACIMAFNFYHTIGGLLGYQWAFIFIGAAAVFDFLDGAMARLLHAYSDMGKELDSLCDLISFGMAPAMLVYNYVNYYHDGLSWWSLMALLIVVMGALRLAKFNVDTRQTTSFIGLPIPANAIFWIGMLAWLTKSAYPGDVVMLVMTAVMSYMMVSRLPMFSLKFKHIGLKGNYLRYTIIIAAVVLVSIIGLPGLAWTIMLYLLMSAGAMLMRGEDKQ